MNGVLPDMTYSKELPQSMKILDKRILRNIWMKQFQLNIVKWLYPGTVIVLWLVFYNNAN